MHTLKRFLGFISLSAVGWTSAVPDPDPDEVAAVDWVPLDTVPAWMTTVEVTAWFPLVLRGAWAALRSVNR
jgi:hypothetical protein